MKLRLGWAAAVVVALLLASCGSSGKATTTKTTTGTAGTTATDYGSPGNAAMADRTISVQILPTLMYNPAAISVSPGETVTFKVTNNTTGIHEFVLGDQQEQQSYQNLMASMGSSPMTMPDHSNIVNEQAGVTKELTWTFPSADTTVIYGSHEPGDYTHGLMGTITVGVSTTPTTAMSNMTTTTQMGSQPVTTMGNMPGMTTTTGMANMPGMTTTTTGSSGM